MFLCILEFICLLTCFMECAEIFVLDYESDCLDPIRLLDILNEIDSMDVKIKYIITYFASDDTERSIKVF